MSKKIYISVFIILCLIQNVMSQIANLKGSIEYNNIVVIDTVLNDLDETNGTLYFNMEKGHSIYIWKKRNPDSKREIQKMEDGSIKGIRKNGSAGTDAIGKRVYKSYNSSIISVRELIDKWYIISDTLDIQWSIKTETKTLNDMVLQKAECDFRGRHYIAWFNPKIPIPDGPWKLRGLPGLIIEAYDEKQHIQFNFISLNIPFQYNENIEAPFAGEPISQKEYFMRKIKALEDAPKRIEAQMKQQGLTFTGTIRTNVMERCY